jgi:hypothetical protein
VRYDRKADSGNVIAMNFCAHCHGWLWNDPPLPGIKVARADRRPGSTGPTRPALGFASYMQPAIGVRVPHLQHPIFQKRLLAVPRA